MTLRVIDEIGNKQDYEVQFVPRIGELIRLTYSIGTTTHDNPLREHFSRVKDVMHVLDHPLDSQIVILIGEEENHQDWPS